MKAYNLEDMTQEQVQHYIELQVEVERLKNENNKLIKALKSAQVTLEGIKWIINEYTKNNERGGKKSPGKSVNQGTNTRYNITE